ncbi:hypothetical protein FTO68_01475 [Methanocalculus taiwanensis]|uniref:Uncharacterized protein n=1 Tax=Methanocalculus taiwanensis TaxID=106207 RepID=A0ABD4TIS2_9EURY|nr:hypothetical protein [Methanocalculus taiwanensis]MCQ1537663.1 hypothetical protein [Methanocalculus taiwanensis]
MITDEKKGRFVQGRFVIDEEPDTEPAHSEKAEETKTKKPTIEDLIQLTSKNVEMTIESVVILGKKLFLTQEGRDHIEAKTRKIGDDLQKTVGEIAEAAKKAIEKK